ncbi:hypothetical protein MLD59_14300 [Verrucomicrobiaceae bacterium E54]|nr:hypothetical protein [Verrucomicrobiaceae bacterium E54]
MAIDEGRKEAQNHAEVWHSYQRAEGLIDRILSEYPASETATGLSTGSPLISGLTLDQFRALEGSLAELVEAERSPTACALLLAKSIEGNAHRSRAMADVAGVLADSGRREQALALLSQATATARENPWPDLELMGKIAATYAEVGQQEQASRILSQTLALARTVKRRYDGLVFNGLGEIPGIAIGFAEVGAFQEAVETARLIESGAGDQARARAGMASAHAKAGHKEEAARLLSQALEAAEAHASERRGYDRSKPLTLVADAYVQMGERAQAALVLSRALEVARTIPASYNRLEALAEVAVSHADNGALKQSLEILDSIEGLRADDRGLAVAEIAQAHGRAGKDEQARLLLSRILRSVEEEEKRWGRDARVNVLTRMSEVHLELGEREQAERLLNRALEADGALGSRRYDFLRRVDIAAGFRELGQDEQAERLLSEALQAAEGIQRPTDRAWAWYAIADGRAEAGQGEQALPWLSQALDAATTYELAEVDSDVLRKLSISHAKAGEMEGAIKMAGMIRQKMAQSICLAAVAGVHARKGQGEQALTLLSQATEVAQDIRSIDERCQALTEIAARYAEIGNMALALPVLSKALDAAKADKHIQSQRSWVLRVIAVRYAEYGDFDRALEVAGRMADAGGRARALVGIADQHAHAGQLKQAERLLSRAEEAAASIKEKDDQARALADIAGSYGRKGQRARAEKRLTQALEMAGAIEAAKDRPWALSTIAGEYAEVGNKGKASRLFSQALGTANSIEDLQDRSWALADVASVHAQHGNMEQASQILARAFDAANAIEDAQMRESSIDLIAILHGSAWNLSQIIEAARPFEYPDWLFLVMSDLAGEVSQLKESDKAVLLEITRAIRPLSEFWESTGQPARLKTKN